jgi:hypothetical protein
MKSIVDEKKLEECDFTKHKIVYEGCPDHPHKTGWGCPLDESGNCLCKSAKAPYWTIDGENIGAFTKNIKQKSEYITYIFIESNNECRKIGEGKVKRIRANLKAHYNHGITKSIRTANDRKASNQIAKRCRENPICYLLIKRSGSKDEAKNIESKIKELYYGWLDYDQKNKAPHMDCPNATRFYR